MKNETKNLDQTIEEEEEGERKKKKKKEKKERVGESGQEDEDEDGGRGGLRGQTVFYFGDIIGIYQVLYRNYCERLDERL